MKFEELYERTISRELCQEDAASILGVTERTFRRWRDRFEAEGADGLYDRRLGRVSGCRAGVDEVLAVLELFDTNYDDFTAYHFSEKLVAEHGTAQLQPGSSDPAGARPDQAGAASRGAPAQAAGRGGRCQG